MVEDWLARWREGRTGWHEAGGNALLRRYWPRLAPATRVLVPLCGKSVDLVWLARTGCDVVGIELSELAAEALFDEHGLAHGRSEDGGLPCLKAEGLPLCICIGDFFAYRGGPFDALYDRGALVAVDPADRPRYAATLRQLLRPDAFRLIIVLEYDQRLVAGPPFAVPERELLSYWPDLRRHFAHDDLANAPPKFLEAGLASLTEVVWMSDSGAPGIS